jgi:hypothetical protein
MYRPLESFMLDTSGVILFLTIKADDGINMHEATTMSLAAFLVDILWQQLLSLVNLCMVHVLVLIGTRRRVWNKTECLES